MVSYETANGRINVIEIPSARPNGYGVLCIHGVCCDARIFAYAGAKLSQAGYDVYSMDLPGHGESDGKRGDLNFEACLKSMDNIISELRKKSSKVFILAHSFGSTFALWYAHLFKNTIDGIILLAPYIRVGRGKRSDAEPSTSTFLYLLLCRLFTPYKRVNFGKILPGYVKIGGSQLPRMVQDQKLNFDYSFRYLVDIVAMRNSKLEELSDVDVPVLIVHGNRDKNVYPQVSQEFFELLHTNKEIKILDCNHWFYDAIFFSQSSEYLEEDRTKFISSIVAWLKKA
ncbi:MAG TPA: alpha/beta fold hydrolase [Nitrososphaera sp.]